LGASFSDRSVRPWPKWVPLGEAVEYACMSRRRLLGLIRAGEIDAYQDPEDRRGPKGGGRWWVYLPSIDAYHDRRSGRGVIDEVVARVTGEVHGRVQAR